MLLKLGGISVVFFCLSTVTNAALQGMDKMMEPVKNAAISFLIHLVALLIMLFVFRWSIYAVAISKVILSGCICILNAWDLQKACRYKQEVKKTFIIPAAASIVMGGGAFLMFSVLDLILPEAAATIAALIVAVIIYGICMALMGGISEAEIADIPQGRKLVVLLKKFHLLKK